MRCPYKNDDYRKHFAAHRRAMRTPQHDYDGKAPICHGQTLDADLVRYAAALGRARGQLPENLSKYYAWVLRHDDGTGVASFTPGCWVKGHYGQEMRPDETAVPVRIELRFLDWAPAPAIEEAA